MTPDKFAAQIMQYNPQSSTEENCAIIKADAFRWLPTVPDGSVDLILTDPPYAISRKTGFSALGAKSVERFAVSMEFGTWDTKEINLKAFCKQAIRILRTGGTVIVFYDIWKITNLAEAMTEAGFKQLRLIHWEKTNPVPLNSKRNYLTNSREIAVLAVKGGKPTFNGEYDKGIYHYPIPNNGKRFHPTQKPMSLFLDLIQKHSVKGDLVLDPFLGSGTTAVAAIKTGRRFAGCERDSGYVKIAKKRAQDAEKAVKS